MSALTIDSPAESAALIRRVLAGEPGPARDIVLANTAAALMVCGRAGNLKEGVALASAAIDTGRATELLTRLAEVSHRA
jgi:anthranilate phosphoribosyltransferase